jgi:hypothetical protein
MFDEGYEYVFGVVFFEGEVWVVGDFAGGGLVFG